MTRRDDMNWEIIGNVLAAESSGKDPKLFSSRKTLFGIPSALDQELANAADLPTSATETAATQGAHKVEHPLDPVFDEHSRVLVLGTMPSPKSRETGFYYNHPQNRFWRVMARLFGEAVPTTNDQKRDLVLRHGIALWDVLASCVIEGAKDASIAECVPNDIGYLLARAPIEAVFCTGAKAAELYAKHCERDTGIPAVKLPSTSPANAAFSLEDLVSAYHALLPYCIR